jgi:putative membrane protein insertion efficiency factor
MNYRSTIRAIASFPFIILVWIYRFILRPFLRPTCRYIPSCSEYTLQALRTLPTHTALLLSARRILSCNPYGGSGYDPVPQKCEHNTTTN